MDLADHLRIIAQSWGRILLIALGVAVLVFVASASRDDVYESGSFLSVSAGRSDLAGIATKDETVFLTDTYAELATTEPVIDAAAARSGLDISPSQANSRVSASASGDVGFITVNATGPRPRDASRLANAVGRSLIDEVDRLQEHTLEEDLRPLNRRIEELQAELSATLPGSPEADNLRARFDALLEVAVNRQTEPRNRVETVSSASPASDPIAPRPRRDSLLGFVVALVLAAEGSVALHVLGDRFRRATSTEEISRLTELPVLATVPDASGADVVEAFRILRTSLMLIMQGQNGDRQLNTVAVVSSNAGAGKSFTSLHLAESLSTPFSRVILIDADLRRPVLHEWLEVEREPGISDLLERTDSITPADAVRRVRGVARLRMIPSGKPVSDPASTLGGRSFARLLDELDEAGSVIVVDTPPVTVVADAIPVATQCELAVFVVDVTTSRRRTVKNALVELRRAGVNLVGVVVNRAATPRQASYYGYRTPTTVDEAARQA